MFCKQMAFRQKLIHKDAIRTQKKCDKKRKREFEKRQHTSKTDEELNIGDRTLRYVGDKYNGNQRKLQQKYDDKIWKMIKIKGNGNLVRIEADTGETKDIHQTKIRKSLNEEKDDEGDKDNDMNDEGNPESYWAYIDLIDGNVDIEDMMNEDEFNDWMKRKSSRYKENKRMIGNRLIGCG